MTLLEFLNTDKGALIGGVVVMAIIVAFNYSIHHFFHV